jgi:hypothetical protein
MTTSSGAGRYLFLLTSGLIAVLSMTGCGAAPRTTTAPAASPARSAPGDVPGGSPRSCTAANLAGRGGREGENIGAHGDIQVTNTGHSACTLDGVPRLKIVGANGRPLRVRQVRPVTPVTAPVTLSPGKPGAALLTVYWSNWCGRPLGGLRLRVTLPGSGGTLIVPFNGPPDYDFVPGCVNHRQASTISVISAYSAGVPG